MSHKAESISNERSRVRSSKPCKYCGRRKTKYYGSKGTASRRCESCEATGYGALLEPANGSEGIANLDAEVRRLDDQPIMCDTEEMSFRYDSGVDTPTASMTPTSYRSVPVQVNFSDDLARLTPDSSSGRGYMPKRESDLEILPFSNEVLLSVDQDSLCHSAWAGLEVIRRLRVHMDTLAALGNASEDPAGGILVAALDRSIALDLLRTRSLSQVFWPPPARVKKCVDIAYTEVFSLWPIQNRSVIDSIIYRVYSTTTFSQLNVHEDELALLYATLALGERFEWMRVPIIDRELHDHRLDGMAYFKAAQSLVRPSECHRSLAALQTTMCLALYLITASAHTLAYSYISGALVAAASIREIQNSEGSYRPDGSPQAIDRNTRQTLRALDVYIGNFLGFSSNRLAPSRTVKNYSSSVDLSKGSEDVNVFAEAHATLLDVLTAIQQKAYFRDRSKRCGSHVVPNDIILEISANFGAWYETKISLLEPPPQMASVQLFRPRLLLQYAYACVRMIAYAPFLHYVSQGKAAERNHGGYLAGSLCVMAAIQASRVARVLESHSMFNICCTLSYNGPVLAAAILLTIELGADEFPGIEEVREASRSAEYTLHQVAMRDTTASTCAESLKPLYRIVEQRYQ